VENLNPAPAASAPAAAPAAAEPVTQSAAHAAVASGSSRDFRVARRAERAGTPLPPVPVSTEPAPAANTPAPTTTSPAPAPAADPQLSRRQQEANERTRRAVEQATADLRRELDSVRAQLPKPAAATPPAAPTPSEPAWKKYHDHPDAPKIADFDSLSEHSAAMAHFVMEQANAERAQASQQQELTSAQQARAGKFVEQLQAAKVADPEFTNKLTPEVRALKPFGALQPGEGAGPLNVVAEQVFDSPIAPKVLLHFSQHPDDLRRLATVPDHIRAMPAHAQAANTFSGSCGSSASSKGVSKRLRPRPLRQPKPSPKLRRRRPRSGRDLQRPPTRRVRRSGVVIPARTVGCVVKSAQRDVARSFVPMKHLARFENRPLWRHLATWIPFVLITLVVSHYLGKHAGAAGGGLLLALNNSFEVVDWVMQESLDLLVNKLGILSHFNTEVQREFEKDFAPGETVRVKYPQEYLIRDGMAYNAQPLNRRHTTVSCTIFSASTSIGIPSRRR
jgi:hypothetical protein